MVFLYILATESINSSFLCHVDTLFSENTICFSCCHYASYGSSATVFVLCFSFATLKIKLHDFGIIYADSPGHDSFYVFGHASADRRFFCIRYQMIEMLVDDYSESLILLYETRMQDWILLSGMILQEKNNVESCHLI